MSFSLHDLLAKKIKTIAESNELIVKQEHFNLLIHELDSKQWVKLYRVLERFTNAELKKTFVAELEGWEFQALKLVPIEKKKSKIKVLYESISRGYK